MYWDYELNSELVL